ncbi:uncharacterized protein LOC128409655 [Podarcis raffonei]|uniref:uncharacterized protein LOC128409655 n=1 Tax=Podarcis raffonei TaxID=65483 RepID=UPI0023296F3B|nr:uncharacterized protein LOC128409655 [Podarcis raffonei]
MANVSINPKDICSEKSPAGHYSQEATSPLSCDQSAGGEGVWRENHPALECSDGSIQRGAGERRERASGEYWKHEGGVKIPPLGARHSDATVLPDSWRGPSRASRGAQGVSAKRRSLLLDGGRAGGWLPFANVPGGIAPSERAPCRGWGPEGASLNRHQKERAEAGQARRDPPSSWAAAVAAAAAGFAAVAAAVAQPCPAQPSCSSGFSACVIEHVGLFLRRGNFRGILASNLDSRTGDIGMGRRGRERELLDLLHRSRRLFPGRDRLAAFPFCWRLELRSCVVKPRLDAPTRFFLPCPLLHVWEMWHACLWKEWALGVGVLLLLCVFLAQVANLRPPCTSLP